MPAPQIESFTFTKEIPLADADGNAIKEGSVLRHLTDKEWTGVVTFINRPGGPRGASFSSVGDIGIQAQPGLTRVTNCYSKWKHVPQEEQSYEHRYLSWLCRPYAHDDSRDASKDEGRAIDGIMALLPADLVNWEMGPWPDRIEDALAFLAAHLANPKGRITL